MDLEIEMMVPFDIMAVYPDEDIDEYFIIPQFVEIIKLLEINFDARRVLDFIYNQDFSHSAIEVHYSNSGDNEFLVLDTYMGITDQLDFIFLC